MKISAIIIGKNDGWKDDKRILLSLLSTLEECDEVWYIDWNSPEKSCIENIRSNIPKTGKLHHVIITSDMAAQFLELYPNAQKFHYGTGKNIAIRRTDADYIISTQLDIIFPKREWLERYVNDTTFYTISRREAPLNICNEFSISEWKELRDTLAEKIPPRYWLSEVSEHDHYSIINCCGDFQMAHKNIWQNIRGFEEGMTDTIFEDSNVQKKVITHGFKLKALFNVPVFHIEHPNYLTQETVRSHQSYNNPMIWVEHFNKSLNHYQWGCNDYKFYIERI